MTAGENLHQQPETVMPPVGTFEHMEYLANYEKPHPSVESFLQETLAATSFARVIRRHRAFWPMHKLTVADMDSRLMSHADTWPHFFRGSLDLAPTAEALPIENEGDIPPWGLKELRRDNKLTIHGRSHIQWNNVQDMCNYSIIIPMRDMLYYDPTRPANASLSFDRTLPDGKQTMTYNEGSHPDYNERIPKVFMKIVQQASKDAFELLNYGNVRREYPLIKVQWHPEYAKDDPDELMPPQLTVANQYYLGDDPDEFPKKIQEAYEAGIIPTPTLGEFLKAA